VPLPSCKQIEPACSSSTFVLDSSVLHRPHTLMKPSARLCAEAAPPPCVTRSFTATRRCADSQEQGFLQMGRRRCGCKAPLRTPAPAPTCRATTLAARLGCSSAASTASSLPAGAFHTLPGAPTPEGPPARGAAALSSCGFLPRRPSGVSGTFGTAAAAAGLVGNGLEVAGAGRALLLSRRPTRSLTRPSMRTSTCSGQSKRKALAEQAMRGGRGM